MTPTNAAARSPREKRRHPRSGGKSIGGLELSICVATALSVVSALAYLWTVPMESVLWWGYGLFFLGAALIQGVYGVVILRWPTQRLFFAGIWMNLALVSLYAIWYADGIPFGPHTGMLLHPDRLGMTGVLAEAGLVLTLVSLLEGRLRAGTINAILAFGAVVWIVVIAGMFV